MRYFRIEHGLLSKETEVYIDDIENDDYEMVRRDIFRCNKINKWPKGLFAVCNGDPRGCDFIPDMYERVYVSKKAKVILESISDFPAQFLPVKIGEAEDSSLKTYYMMHVFAICSSLDMSKTRYEILDIGENEEKSIVIVGRNKKTITLSRSKLKAINYPIYYEQGCESLLILREDLVDCVEKAGLRGLEYEEVHIS